MVLLAHTVLVQVATFVLRPTSTYRALELGVPAAWLGVLSACFAVAPLILAVPSGQAVDCFGERRVMLVGEAPGADEDGGGGNPALSGIAGAGEGEQGLFDQAVALVSREGKASTSFIQRHLSIGYNRAAKLIEQMEKEGVVSAANHVGKREVLTRSTRDDE